MDFLLVLRTTGSSLNTLASDGQLLDHVSVQVEYELNGCDVSRQSFDVYRWDASDVDSAAAQDTSNYMFVEWISPEDTSGTVRTNSTLTMPLVSCTVMGSCSCG